MSERKFVSEQMIGNNSFGGDSKDKVNYIGDLRIIGQVMDNSGKEVVGYVIMNERTQQFKMYTTQQTRALLNKFKFVNAKLDSDQYKIVNTECSMDKILKFNTQMQPIGNFGVTVLAEIHEGDRLSGYKVMDSHGVIAEATEKELINMEKSGQNKILNAKIVSKGDSTYISGIKSKFTVISREKAKGMKKLNDAKRLLTHGDEWRNEMHRKKIMLWLRTSLKNAILRDNPTLNSRIESYGVTDGSSGANYRIKKGLNIGLEAEIIRKEILPKLLANNPEAKEIFKKIYTKLPFEKTTVIDKGLGVKDEETRVFIVAVSQLVLLDEESNNADYLIKYCSNPYDKKLHKYLAICKQRGLLIRETVDILKKIDNEHSVKKAYQNKMFTTTTFKSAEDIAQLGFAISEANKGYEYKTKTGSIYHLKYVGDYIPDYEQYKPFATCLGDLVILANIERLLSLGTDNNITYEEERAKTEILMAILAIYNPNLCELYLSTRGMSFDFSEYLPGFDFYEPMNFNLPEKIRLYYESGCNVFYGDHGMPVFCTDGNGVEHRYVNRYAKKYLKESDVINYRSLGINRRCNHTMLYDDLAPIINMITSDDCTAEMVANYIGSLRAI